MRQIGRKVLRGNARLYTAARRASLVAKFVAKRPHEPEFRWLGRLTGPGVLLDVGANSGQSALSFRMFNRQVPIVSLEPNPACEPDLRLVRRLIRRFDYAMIAAGDRCGTVALTIPTIRNVAASQAASLDPGFIARRRHQIERRTGGSVTLSQVTVPLATVDSLRLDVLAMKIDVEGTELDVLEGAASTIERQRPVVMLEASSGSGGAAHFLRSKGYELHTFDAARGDLADYDPARPVLNIIALPDPGA
jgi:FkbM family methyltransferase